MIDWLIDWLVSLFNMGGGVFVIISGMYISLNYSPPPGGLFVMIRKKWSTIKHKFASSFIFFYSLQNIGNKFQENIHLCIFSHQFEQEDPVFFGFWPSTVLGLAWDVLQLVRLFLTKILTRVRSEAAIYTTVILQWFKLYCSIWANQYKLVHTH